jgi:hypothetical protein
MHYRPCGAGSIFELDPSLDDRAPTSLSDTSASVTLPVDNGSTSLERRVRLLKC